MTGGGVRKPFTIRMAKPAFTSSSVLTSRNGSR